MLWYDCVVEVGDSQPLSLVYTIKVRYISLLLGEVLWIYHKQEQVVWQCRKGKRRSLSRLDTSCFCLGFLSPPPLIFVSVSELICHVLFLVLCIFNYYLNFWRGDGKSSMATCFFLLVFLKWYYLICIYIIGLFTFFFLCGSYLLVCIFHFAVI